MIVITGLGRCGTSILTKYFKELGFGLGRNIHWHKQVRAGYELSTFYSIIDWMYCEYCRKGKRINLDDKCKCEYWNKYSYREALDKFDKDDKQGYVDIVKDPRITWHPDIIEALWEVRKDVKLIICHRKVESIYNSRKSLPIQYDDPKPRKELNEYKIDFCDFYTRVLELNIPHEVIMFPYFLRDFNAMYNKLKVILPHDFESGKKVFDKIVDGSLLK